MEAGNSKLATPSSMRGPTAGVLGQGNSAFSAPSWSFSAIGNSNERSNSSSREAPGSNLDSTEGASHAQGSPLVRGASSAYPEQNPVPASSTTANYSILVDNMEARSSNNLDRGSPAPGETPSLGSGFDLIRAAVASMNADPASFSSPPGVGAAVTTTPLGHEGQIHNHMEMSGVLLTHSDTIGAPARPSSASSVASSPEDDGEVSHHDMMENFVALESGTFRSEPGHTSDSEMTEAEESRDGVYISHGYTVTNHMHLQAVVHQLFQNSGMGHNISTIPEDSEDGNEGALFQDYDPVIEPLQMALFEHDDDPDDTRKFYLGDEDDIGYSKSTCPAVAPLTEIDFDDFYQESDSQPMPQGSDLADPSFSASQDEHDYFDDDSNDEGFGADHFPGYLHGSSMAPCFPAWRLLLRSLWRYFLG